MIENSLKSHAFKLKGRLYTLPVLQLLETNSALLAEQLTAVVAQAPRLFDNTPVVLDCSGLTESMSDDLQLNLADVCNVMRASGLMPVAIQGGTTLIQACALSQGLAILHASSTQDKAWGSDHTAQTSVPSLETIKSKRVTMPVRSGQQVVSKGGDLVVVASVSHGAELLADGDIHVYGALRGRALAGIAGDKQARIFCQSLEAELVSIAGIYRLSDAIEPTSSPCQIFIQDDRIQIEPLK